LRPLLLAHLAATAAMTGIVAFAALVHDPLADRVAQERFTDYAAQRLRRAGWLLIPLMLAEAACAALVARAGGALAWSGAALLASAWLLTWSGAVPIHLRLLQGYDAALHRRLLAVHRARLAAWTARVVVAFALGLARG
jgi:hypothetical protein